MNRRTFTTFAISTVIRTFRRADSSTPKPSFYENQNSENEVGANLQVNLDQYLQDRYTHHINKEYVSLKQKWHETNPAKNQLQLPEPQYDRTFFPHKNSIIRDYIPYCGGLME